MSRRTPALAGLAVLGVTAALLPGAPGHATTPGDAGKIVFVASTAGNLDLMVTDGSTTTQLTSDTGRDIDPEWSPDGTKIAWVSDQPDAEGPEGHRNIWVMDADGTDMVNLTDGADTTGFANEGTDPTWSPNGAMIAFTHQGDVWVIPSTGGPETNLMPGSGAENAGIHPSWSPDGTKIAFVRQGEIWVMNADGTSATPLTATPHPAAEQRPDWSPDGARLVYERQGQIWRMNADGSRQVPVSAGADRGGTHAKWSPEGDKIVWSSSGYDATNEPDIFTARPDGTQVVRLLASTGTSDESPAWQPLAGGTPRGTYTTTGVGVKRKVKVSGELFPADAGDQVRVTLLRKTRKGFKKVASVDTLVSHYGAYSAAIGRPDARTCRVVAKFRGDADSAPSKDSVTFDC